jgi:hypothetical protein
MKNAKMGMTRDRRRSRSRTLTSTQRPSVQSMDSAAGARIQDVLCATKPRYMPTRAPR